MLTATVSGQASFKRFAVSCKEVANTGLDKELNRGLIQAGEDIAQAVRTSSDIFMPSGYEDIFRARMLSTVELNRARRAVTITVYAKGRSGRRDVERLEKGILKHPVYGRYRTLKTGGRQANPWSTTTIRPGFFSVPVGFAGPRAIKQRLDPAVGRALNQIHT